MAIFYDKLNRLATGYLNEDTLAMAGEMANGKKVMLIIHNNDFWEYALIKWLVRYYPKSIIAAENPLELTDLYVFGSIAEEIWNFCNKHGNPIEMDGFKGFYAELMTDIYWDAAKAIYRRIQPFIPGVDKSRAVNIILPYITEECQIDYDGDVIYDFAEIMDLLDKNA